MSSAQLWLAQRLRSCTKEEVILIVARLYGGDRLRKDLMCAKIRWCVLLREIWLCWVVYTLAVKFKNHAYALGVITRAWFRWAPHWGSGSRPPTCDCRVGRNMLWWGGMCWQAPGHVITASHWIVSEFWIKSVAGCVINGKMGNLWFGLETHALELSTTKYKNFFAGQ